MAKASERKTVRTLSVINRLAEASRQRPAELPIKALSAPPQKNIDEPRQETSSQDAAVTDTLAEPPRLQHKNSRGSIGGSTGNQGGKQRTCTGHHSRQTLTTPDTSQPDLVRRATSTMSTRSSSFQTQRQEDLKVGEAWNQMLQNPATRNNNEVCEKFWAEMKSRMMARYGSVAVAFKHGDTSGDGKISFIEFADMLRMIHLPLEMRIARAMFEKAAGGENMKLSLEDFTPLLMERTIRKFTKAFQGFNKKQERVRSHIHTFLNQLSNSSEDTLRGAADRLQRKLTVPFCREFWQSLRETLAKVHSDGNLERSVFQQAISATIGSRFAVVEVTFLMRIFDRVDMHRTGSVHLRMLMTTLILVSEERCKETKLGFLFEVFDTDFDGCLLYEQILDMVRCICAHRFIVEDAPNRVSPDFQEELAQQDGQRLYECLFWHLQRTAKLDSDIVTWRELWRAFEQQPEVVNAVMPGSFRIHWVIQPTSEENEMNAQSSEQPYISSVPSTTSQRLGPSPRPGTGDHDHHHHHSDQHHHNLNVRPNVRRPSKGAWHGSSHETGIENARRASKTVAWETPPREKESTAFRRAVTNRFLTSLKTCGEIRYTELQEGFKSLEEFVVKRDSVLVEDSLCPSGLEGWEKVPKLVVEDADATSPTGASMPLSPLAVPTNSMEALRPSSAVGGMHPAPSEISRPGSSPATPTGLKPTSPTGNSKGVRMIPRVNSAPTGLKKQLASSGSSASLANASSQQQTWTPGRPKSNLGNGRLPGSAAELPTIDTQKWGLEAADRFRLLSTVRSSRNNQRHIKGSCGGADLLGYKCQLCRHQHTMQSVF